MNQRAGIRVSPDHNPVKRRRHVGVVMQCLDALILRESRPGTLLCCRHCRFRRVHLRLCGQILRLGVVQFLLCNKPGPPRRRLFQPFRCCMQSCVLRLCPIDLVLRPRDFILGLLQLERSAL